MPKKTKGNCFTISKTINDNTNRHNKKHLSADIWP